jgi:hypothetical protein
MKLKPAVVLLLMSAALAAASPCSADVELDVLKTLKLAEEPVDMAFSTSRNEIYVLTADGALLIYAADGSLSERVAVGKQFDHINLVQTRDFDVLFLASRKEKSVEIVRLDFVQDIDVSGSPFMGPENAPVVIAVFSDFQ